MPVTIVSTHDREDFTVNVAAMDGGYYLKPTRGGDQVPELHFQKDCVFDDRQTAAKAAQDTLGLMVDIKAGRIGGDKARKRLDSIVRDRGGRRE